MLYQLSYCGKMLSVEDCDANFVNLIDFPTKSRDFFTLSPHFFGFREKNRNRERFDANPHARFRFRHTAGYFNTRCNSSGSSVVM